MGIFDFLFGPNEPKYETLSAEEKTKITEEDFINPNYNKIISSHEREQNYKKRLIKDPVLRKWIDRSALGQALWNKEHRDQYCLSKENELKNYIYQVKLRNPYGIAQHLGVSEVELKEYCHKNDL